MWTYYARLEFGHQHLQSARQILSRRSPSKTSVEIEAFKPQRTKPSLRLDSATIPSKKNKSPLEHLAQAFPKKALDGVPREGNVTDTIPTDRSVLSHHEENQREPLPLDPVTRERHQEREHHRSQKHRRRHASRASEHLLHLLRGSREEARAAEGDGVSEGGGEDVRT